MGQVCYVKVASWHTERHEAIAAFRDGIKDGPAGVISSLFVATVISGELSSLKLIMGAFYLKLMSKHVFARFKEWPLRDVLLKHITECNKMTFQLQFE